MSVIIESRPKRNFPKSTINKNDIIKKKINCGNNASYKNNEEVEFDCQFKIKEHNYNPERECIDVVRDANSRYYDICSNECVDISVEEALKKVELKSCLLVDIRDCRTFNNGHIKNALLFNCQKRMMVLKAKKSWDMFNKSQYDKVLIYDQKGDKSPLLQDFIDFIKKDFTNIYFIEGGYEEFFKCADRSLIESEIPEDKFDEYHYSPTNNSTKSTDVLNATISEILPFIFIGNELDSKDLDLLKKKKITHILNVTTSLPCIHEGLFVYKRLSATDCNKQDMRAYYNEAFSFIDQAIQAKGKVLVHCWAGVSRSATIVAAYLLKHTELTVLQTISFLQSRRPIIEPNFNFLGQLERYYCDLEKGFESRKLVYLKPVDDFLKKLADIDRVKDLSLSGESSSSVSPMSPQPAKPYFNFIK